MYVGEDLNRTIISSKDWWLQTKMKLRSFGMFSLPCTLSQIPEKIKRPGHQMYFAKKTTVYSLNVMSLKMNANRKQMIVHSMQNTTVKGRRIIQNTDAKMK